LYGFRTKISIEKNCAIEDVNCDIFNAKNDEKVPFRKGKPERNFVQMLHQIAEQLLNATKLLIFGK
jgi:hypothetical protein